MSRGNVFKLSGNMALNNNQYPPDVSDVKNSLQLLKSKQNQKRESQDNFNPNYQYQDQYNNPKSEQIQRSNLNKQINANIPQNYKRNQGLGYGIGSSSRNQIPPSYKDSSIKEIPRQKPSQDKNKPPQDYNKDRRSQPKQVRQDEYYPNKQVMKSKGNIRSPIESSYNYQKSSVNRNRKEQPVYNPINLPVQKSIKEANRQNKVDIVEYNPRDFMECGAGCGRKFNPDSLAKHQAICKKVFQKKRKQFNAQAHRIVEKDQIKLMKNGQIANKKLQQKKRNGKMAKWKAESLAFRAILKEGKSNLTDADKKMIQHSKQVAKQDQIKCPYCGRVFNQTAGPRHITFCQNQQKKLITKKTK